VGDFPGGYYGNVATGGEELPDFGAFTGQIDPAGFGLRVLLERAIWDSVESS
jgi:hypothetical protein